MPFCSLDEAWGVNPAPVKYPKSDVYTGDGKSIYNDCEKSNSSMEPPLTKSWSRTNERLPQTSGPTNRYGGNYDNNIGTYGNREEGSHGLKRQVSEPENYNSPTFNYKNNETPITKYDREYVNAHDEPKSHRRPVHAIEPRKQPAREQYDNINAGDIDRIIYSENHRKKWKNNKHGKANQHDDDNDSDMESVASSASYTPEIRNDTPIDVNRRYRELESKFGSKRGTDHTKMIRHLLTQNEQLKTALAELKEKPVPQSTGFFSIWDLLIVILVGIIMICVLDYVYRIALSKASASMPVLQ
jgi:hypothetical protein